MRQMTFLSATNEAMKEEMERDHRVILIGQGVETGGSYKTAEGLREQFGRKRVRDTPISEDSMVGCAVGAAITGLRPIVQILYCDFVFRAMDQIANQAAKYRYMTGGQLTAPMVIRTSCGYGSSRAAHHSQSLEAMFSNIAGIKIVIPSTPRDAKGLFKSAIREDDPVIFMDAFLLYGIKGPVPEDDYTIPLGEAEVKREGKDITIVATSTMVHEALRAAEKLEKDKIDVEIIDPRTLVPLDLSTILRSVRKTNRLMVVEAGCTRSGVGAEISAKVMEEAFDYLDSPPVRIGVPDTPIPFSSRLEAAVLPNSTRIIDKTHQILK